MKKQTIRQITALLLLLAPLMILAQPGPPAGGGPPCGPPFGPACPIDGGVSLLIAAGIALGGKKAYDLGRKKA
ncbi:MAG: PID-CTERM protein-sorting domain-containing protein [Flavobacteriales bacterium]